MDLCYYDHRRRPLQQECIEVSITIKDVRVWYEFRYLSLYLLYL